MGFVGSNAIASLYFWMAELYDLAEIRALPSNLRASAFFLSSAEGVFSEAEVAWAEELDSAAAGAAAAAGVFFAFRVLRATSKMDCRLAGLMLY